MNKLFLALTIILLVGCKNEEAISTKESNTNKTDFLWDFSEPKQYIYTFEQTSSGESKFGEDSPTNRNKISGSGLLTVDVKENELADLKIGELNMELIQVDENGNSAEPSQQVSPPQIVNNMKPDGSFSVDGANMFFKLYLPIPNQPLEIGETASIPLKSPFNAGGRLIYAEGQNKLTFTGYDEFEGKKCAVLKGDIDISQLDIPEDIKGDNKYETKGNATYYFDVKNGYYVAADVKFDMNMIMELNAGTDLSQKMEMSTDNTYTIRLDKIEQ